MQPCAWPFGIEVAVRDRDVENEPSGERSATSDQRRAISDERSATSDQRSADLSPSSPLSSRLMARRLYLAAGLGVDVATSIRRADADWPSSKLVALSSRKSFTAPPGPSRSGTPSAAPPLASSSRSNPTAGAWRSWHPRRSRDA